MINSKQNQNHSGAIEPIVSVAIPYKAHAPSLINACSGVAFASHVAILGVDRNHLQQVTVHMGEARLPNGSPSKYLACQDYYNYVKPKSVTVLNYYFSSGL